MNSNFLLQYSMHLRLKFNFISIIHIRGNSYANLQNIYADFEKAEHNAVLHIFPNCKNACQVSNGFCDLMVVKITLHQAAIFNTNLWACELINNPKTTNGAESYVRLPNLTITYRVRVNISKLKKVGKWVPLCCTLGGGVEIGLGTVQVETSINYDLKLYHNKLMAISGLLKPI
ncbi:hypothetical protein AGLY_004097 [Aphis glycines]|uniref:Uncharacterized protein n=1 Tax=Aphis glycines TaxID=307491 RepID=A0A6G0TX45_APHGL|nr:hypothetical protein AGLY_004097 [Aphis glycines]